ncbi:MAG: DNA repair protein RecN [Gammaproteobacteria bacterium]|nr:DNA repair protein RecN [Gammaproteobacteria bacterium]MDH3507606.1 DNA repair protein RecN [Gammaproteobacteria bacterium]
MLSLIRIRNYAVIDEVELEFNQGLSVMTGETGAGKSILVDALGLALGDRADASAVRQGTDRAEISVLFDCDTDHPASAWLREQGLDQDDCCLIRRLISTEGRSRAFVNSHPVTLQDLKTLGDFLVNIHGQHAHQSLRSSTAQREILDFHGNHSELSKSVAEKFGAWQILERDLERRRRGGEDREAQLELLRFQVQELERLGLADGELSELESERNRLANADRLAGGLTTALGRIYEDETGSAYELTAGAGRELQELAELDPELKPSAQMLAEAEIQLREAAADIARYRDRLEFDPQRLEWLETRLATIADLARKHKVASSALVDLKGQLESRIEEIDAGAESLELLTERAERACREYFDVAELLSQARTAAAATLAEQVSAQLRQLGLPHGRFRAALSPKPPERADANGIDHIELQVTLNPGQDFGPISKVASGGELSRVSLALEVIAAGATSVPTLVFDEVDSGIGGGVAEIVGRRLREIASDRQVLCVTHLAQVASQGQHHFRVSKLTDGEHSRTNVRALGADERIEELSRMLGGIEITDTTRAHAEEMIGRAGQ